MYQPPSSTFEKLKVSEQMTAVVKLDISPTKMVTDSEKKYKEAKMKEITSAVCALLNSGGGKLVLHTLNDKLGQQKIISRCIRMIEQRLIDMTGSPTMVLNIHVNFEIPNEEIVLGISKSSLFITVNYNLYLPSETQVVPVSCMEPAEKVKETFFNRKNIAQEVEIASHEKQFVKDQTNGLRQRKEIQFRNLKAASSKCVKLADRMIGKSNKFSCNVSAFANYNGGHIYYGITDDGTVEGERIENKNDVDEITKKVGKTIDKMIWPDHFGKPQRGKHWDIFFQPVLDINLNVIPSTYVIVVYVAPCLGGVFTEEPESYEMVNGKVEKMSYPEWKRKVLHPLSTVSYRKHEIPPVVPRYTWSSPKNQTLFVKVTGFLMKFINNGSWEELSKQAKTIEERYAEESGAKLAVLPELVIAYCRRGHSNKAELALQQYYRILATSQDVFIFEALGLYLRATLELSRGNFETSYANLTDALCKVDQIEPGFLTAAVCSLAAKLRGIIDSQVQDPDKKMPSSQNEKADILFTKTFEHLRGADKFPEARVMVEQCTHINLAFLHLGCSLSEDAVSKQVRDNERLVKANSSLMAVSQSIFEGYPLGLFQEIQFCLVMSVLYYRRSQVELHDKRVHLLQTAFNSSKKAENLARKCQSDEMVRYSQKYMAVCTEDLIRANLRNKRGIIELLGD